MRTAALTAATVAAAVVLTGCSSADEERADERAGALAAAQAYVDAIAALDPEAADAMTDPEALSSTGGDGTDIRAALLDAVDPITDPWVSVVSTSWDHDPEFGPVEYAIAVSYTVGDLSGGETITVRLEEDGDPDDVDDWSVTDPLIVDRPTWSTIPTARVGDVEVHYADELAHLRGYPAGYLLEAAEPGSRVEPMWVALGVADAPPWDDSLPKLGGDPNS